MLAGKPWHVWIADYAQSHQHPINRRCHTVGIPLIAISLLLALAGIFVSRIFNEIWAVAATLFVIGWVLQFIGHWFEGKPPEFFKDWRFLLVGLRWWAAKLRGQA
jgi:uncharacterized membrane protein YGL010W